MDAGEAAWNLDVVAKRRPSEAFIDASTPGDRRLINSDLAFTHDYVIQGDYSGYQVWDIANHARRGSARTHRLRDAGSGGAVSKERLRGIRIFDISEMACPKLLTTSR
jgi:hypothetical protein